MTIAPAATLRRAVSTEMQPPCPCRGAAETRCGILTGYDILISPFTDEAYCRNGREDEAESQLTLNSHALDSRFSAAPNS
jgi:hypothetical protein